MSVVLTVPAVEAVLLFERQECDCHDRHMDPELRRASRGGYDHDDHGPLSEWVTMDAEPMVDEPEPRPLKPGDRVTIVAGELPEHLSEHGDWLAWTNRTLSDPFVVDMDERALYLPEPGTVVGSAVIEWVGPIRMEPPAGPTRDAVTINGDGRAWHFVLQLDHDHCGWTPGRWAVRLTDTEAAK